MAEGEGRAVVSKRVDVRVEGSRPLAGGNEVLGGLALSSGQPEVVGDERGLRAGRPPLTCDQRLGGAAVQEPRRARLVSSVNELAKAVVAEVVAVGCLGEETASRKLLERSDDLLLAAAAHVAREVEIERATENGCGCQNLPRRLPGRRNPRAEEPGDVSGSAHSPAPASDAAARYSTANSGSPTGLLEQSRSEIPGVGSLGKRRDVISGEPRQNDARERPRSAGLGHQAVETVARRDILRPPGQHQTERSSAEPAREIGQHVQRPFVDPVGVVDHDELGRRSKRLSKAFDEPRARTRAVARCLLPGQLRNEASSLG